MRCPYCVSDVHDEALACPHCQRDLFLVKQLLEKVASLEMQLAGAAPVVLADAPAGIDVPAEDLSPPEPVVRHWGQALLFWLLPLVLLLAAHWLVIFVYDAKVLYLRLLALLLPLPCGVLFDRAARLSLGGSVGAAFAMAAAAVFGMSALTGWLDGVPVLPQNMAEVREFIEFALSIGLSFTTGLWLQQWMRRRAAQRAQQAEVRRRLGALALTHGQSMADSLSRLNDIGSAVVAFATTAFSIYTGLKGVLGG